MLQPCGRLKPRTHQTHPPTHLSGAQFAADEQVRTAEPPARPLEVVKEKPFARSTRLRRRAATSRRRRRRLVCIEFQNEFVTEGGKLHDAVKGVMASTGMLEKAAALADEVRGAGGKVFHVPIMFKEDATDNPNKKLGILAGCADGKLFTEATWNTEFCKEMAPKEGDVVVKGKKGLDAFPHSDLEAQLAAAGIETVALCGFLTNCCVESTMRTACEKGFNVITVTDCCAATSEEGRAAARSAVP